MFYKMIARLLARPRLRNWLIARALRTPDEHLPGYMNRYWFFNPYNRETHKPRYPWIPFSIRIHHILRKDLGAHLHDHPWNARTFILRGGYAEYREGQLFYRISGDTAALKFGEFHHIDAVTEGGVWTFFVMGKFRGRWGFDVDGVKVDFKQYLQEYER